MQDYINRDRDYDITPCPKKLQDSIEEIRERNNAVKASIRTLPSISAFTNGYPDCNILSNSGVICLLEASYQTDIKGIETVLSVSGAKNYALTDTDIYLIECCSLGQYSWSKFYDRSGCSPLNQGVCKVFDKMYLAFAEVKEGLDSFPDPVLKKWIRRQLEVNLFHFYHLGLLRLKRLGRSTVVVCEALDALQADYVKFCEFLEIWLNVVS